MPPVFLLICQHFLDFLNNQRGIGKFQYLFDKEVYESWICTKIRVFLDVKKITFCFSYRTTNKLKTNNYLTMLIPKTILLTGFEPFGDFKTNPTQKVIDDIELGRPRASHS